MKDKISLINQKLVELGCEDERIFEMLHAIEDKLVLADKIEQSLYDSDLYLVYKHTDPKGKLYIGITQNHPQTRWNDGSGYEKQSKFYRAIQKYGWINFKHEIIDAGLSKEDAEKIENELIIQYKSYDPQHGYNTKVNLPVSDIASATPHHEPVSESKAILASSKRKVTTKIIKESIKKTAAEKKKNIEKSEPRKLTVFDISAELIKNFSIKTVDDKIYYLSDGFYKLESESPFIQKELLKKYKLPTNKHSEVLNQIKILSFANKEDMKNEDAFAPVIEKETMPLSAIWMKDQNIPLDIIFMYPRDILYEKFLKWCKSQKIKTPLGKKKFYAELIEKYDFTIIQKSDKKRYFAFKK